MRTAVLVCLCVAALASACGSSGAGGSPSAVPPSEPPPSLQAPGADLGVATPCPAGQRASEDRLAALERGLIEVMDGYDGTWGAALIDLACGTSMAVHPDYSQYPASAGKIVVVIAVLRAVDAGLLDFREVEQLIDEVMRYSADFAADALNELLTPEQVQRVLGDAGVSGQTAFEHSWTQASMSAQDLARVWAALLDGRLLAPTWTEYLLARSAEADVPAGFETFPLEIGVEGYDYGQKAGYYISDGVPYFLAGAGYVRPAGGELSPGYALAWLGRTMNPDLYDPQRRQVFPLMLDYIQAMEAG